MADMDIYTSELDPRTGKFLSLCLFTNVENTPEILKKILAGELQCCVLKASMVVDPFQVVVAANKAVLREKAGSLITRSLFTEILYSISSSTNISNSLSKFGIHDRDKNILVAFIHSENEKNEVISPILNQIQGQMTSTSRMEEFADTKLIRKTYKIDDEELRVSSLKDSIVSRIGADYPISLK